jgi:hypothetical protein
MDNKPPLKGQRFNRWLIFVLLELPLLSIGVMLIFGAGMAALFSPMMWMLDWGGAALAQYPFFVGGAALIVFSYPLRKFVVASVFISIGTIIILLEIQSGNSSGSLFGAAFQPETYFSMLGFGVGIGALIGIGAKLFIAVLDDEVIESSACQLIFSILAHTFLIGLPIGLFLSDRLGLMLGTGIGLLGGFGAGGVDLVRYILNYRGATSGAEKIEATNNELIGQ